MQNNTLTDNSNLDTLKLIIPGAIWQQEIHKFIARKNELVSENISKFDIKVSNIMIINDNLESFILMKDGSLLKVDDFMIFTPLREKLLTYGDYKLVDILILDIMGQPASEPISIIDCSLKILACKDTFSISDFIELEDLVCYILDSELKFTRFEAKTTVSYINAMSNFIDPYIDNIVTLNLTKELFAFYNKYSRFEKVIDAFKFRMLISIIKNKIYNRKLLNFIFYNTFETKDAEFLKLNEDFEEKIEYYEMGLLSIVELSYQLLDLFIFSKSIKGMYTKWKI